MPEETVKICQKSMIFDAANTKVFASYISSAAKLCFAGIEN
ncbi:hypothetical protein [Methanobacterium sp.]